MAKQSTILLRCVILFGRIRLQNLQFLGFVLIDIDATVRATVDCGKRVGVAYLVQSCDIEGVDYFLLAGESADHASKANHIRMNYRDGDNVRLWTRIVAQVYQKCWHATMGIGHTAASLTRTRTSHFTPSYSTSNASGTEFDPHTNPTSCFARVSFESEVSKSSGFAGMAEPTSYKGADGPIAKIYSASHAVAYMIAFDANLTRIAVRGYLFL
jgi:hypothetical protein